MDAQRVLDIHREKTYTYHGIFESPVRTDYLENTPDFVIHYYFHCARADGEHAHAHYLFSTNVKPAAIKKRFQRVEPCPEGTFNRIKHVYCEDYLLGCIHYFHCPRGQKRDHVHDFSDARCYEPYLHNTGDKFTFKECQDMKTRLREEVKINHPKDCRCVETKKNYMTKCAIRRTNRNEGVGKFSADFFAPGTQAITKDNIGAVRDFLGGRRHNPYKRPVPNRNVVPVNPDCPFSIIKHMDA